MTLDLLKRAEKGSALNATEHDDNFTAIESAVNAKGDAGDLYWMPEPTGVAATDQAAIVAGFASGKSTLVFAHDGTYETASAITWPTGKSMRSLLAPGMVVIKAAAAHAGDWMFTASGVLSDIGAEGIKFDANTANRANTACGIADFYTGTRRASFTNCRFTGTYSQALTFANAEELRLEANIFHDAKETMLRLLAPINGAELVGNTFARWKTVLVVPTNPAILMTSDNTSGKVKGVRVISNSFRSSALDTFAIETVCGRTDGHFTECVITGNKFGEDVYNSHAKCGISGVFAGSVINDNIFDGTAGFGIELVGNNNTIVGNTVTLSVADAAIVGGALFELIAHTETGMGKNNIVSNNVFNLYNDVQQASGPIQAIAAVYQDGTQIRGNRITYTIPGGATVWGNTTGIALGRRGGSDGPLRNVEVTDNVISCSRSNTGIGIHLAGGVSAEAAASGIDWVQHLVVRENTLIGFDLAIGMGNESNNTYCYFYDNRFIGSANSYYGTLPGTGSVLLTATSKQIPTDGFSVFNKTTTTASEVIARLPAAYAYTIPVSASGSYASSITSATGSPVFSLKKNGTEFGTCTFSGTNGSFTVASATAFAVGDVLTIVGPGTPDGTLAGISFSLLLMRYGA